MQWRGIVLLLVVLFLYTGTAAAYEAAMLYASDESFFNQFGESVAMDGDMAVIGKGGNPQAYFFQQSGGVWTELLMVEGEGGSNFGDGVAISGDYAIVGAHDHEVTGVGPAGAAFVYHFDGSTWTETQMLTADDAGLNDHFGRYLAMDGDYAVIGSYRDDVGGADDAGSAYVYHNNGGTWTQVGHLIASDYSDGANFGCAVAISDGAILVGAQQADPMGASSGAAYIYTHDGSQWNEQMLSASDGAGQDYFGYAVALDGDWGLVGAWGNDEAGNNAGAAYVFEFDGSSWVEAQKLLGPAGYALGSGYGQVVAMEGDFAMVTAVYGFEGDGSVFVYQHDGTSYSELYEMVPWTGGLNHGFGTALALQGGVAMVSDPGESMHMNGAGCAWVIGDLANPVSVDEAGTPERPTDPTLSAVYPNPFNAAATVTVTLPHTAELRVDVVDVLGRTVSVLADEARSAGEHRISLDATGWATGVYLVRASVDGRMLPARKVVLVK